MVSDSLFPALKGMVGINDVAISSAHIPFGGIGEAGIGREGGPYGETSMM